MPNFLVDELRTGQPFVQVCIYSRIVIVMKWHLLLIAPAASWVSLWLIKIDIGKSGSWKFPNLEIGKTSYLEFRSVAIVASWSLSAGSKPLNLFCLFSYTFMRGKCYLVFRSFLWWTWPLEIIIAVEEWTKRHWKQLFWISWSMPWTQLVINKQLFYAQNTSSLCCNHLLQLVVLISSNLFVQLLSDVI